MNKTVTDFGVYIPIYPLSVRPCKQGVCESAVSSPRKFGAEPDRPNIFHYFSALRMASPGSMILLIYADYHIVIGVKTSEVPCR